MRTIVLIGLLMAIPFVNKVYAQSAGKVSQEIILSVVADDEDDDDERDAIGTIGHPQEPVILSLLPQQPYAYLYSNKVVVSFDSACQNVRICIINNDTEAVAFEDVYVGSPEISIRLEERGDYTLKVCADGTKWEGWFVY